MLTILWCRRLFWVTWLSSSLCDGRIVRVLFTAIPALYFESGEPIKFGDALKVLKSNPSRYLLAGVFFTLVSTVGLFLCLSRASNLSNSSCICQQYFQYQ